MSDFAADIPESVARAAHYGTSFVPERRGASERQDYADTLAHDYAALAELAEANGTAELLPAEFDRYREGYCKRTLAYLHSHGRIVSSMIAGPSNFPAARMQKRNSVCDKRRAELIDFRTRALAAIRRTLCPDARPVMAGDANAADRLRAKIAEAEAEQAMMKKVNAAHAAYTRDPASLDAADLPDGRKDSIRRYKPAYSWEPHPHAPYELTNNNANIRRMRARLAQVEANQATPASTVEGDAARVEDCPADNRVRLFFPGKPAPEVRDQLKRSGFRWAPSLGCWQAYRNHRTIAAAREFAGLAAVPA